MQISLSDDCIDLVNFEGGSFEKYTNFCHNFISKGHFSYRICRHDRGKLIASAVSSNDNACMKKVT